MSPPAGTRTGLAWQRTGLGLVAVAVLIGARAFTAGVPSLLVTAGAAGLLGAAVLGVLAPLRQGALRRRRAAGTDVAAPAAVAALTLAVVLVAGTAVWAVLVTLR